MRYIKLKNSLNNRVTKNIYVAVNGDDSNELNAIDNQSYPLKTINKALFVSNTIDSIYDVKIVLLDGVYYTEQIINIQNHTRPVTIQSLNERRAEIKGTKLIERENIQKHTEDIIKFPVDNFVYTLSVNSEVSETDVRYISKLVQTSKPFELLDGYEFSNYQNREYLLKGAAIYPDPILLTLTENSGELDLSTVSYPSSYQMVKDDGAETYTYIVTDGNGNIAKSSPGQINVHLEWSRVVKTRYSKARVSKTVYDSAYKGAIYAGYIAWMTNKSFIYDKYQDGSNYYLVLERDIQASYSQDREEYKVNIWNRIEDLIAGTYCCKLEDGQYYCYYKLLEGENVDNIIVSVGVITQILNIKKSSNISFKNLCIGFSNPKNFDVCQGQTEQGTEGKIVIDNCYNINFDKCLFEGTWDYTIDITNNSKKCIISNSVFTNILGGSVMGSGDSMYCVIYNNVVKKFGRQEEDVAGMLLWKCHKWQIIHNDICDGYYSGICTGWGWSLDIAYSTNLYIAFNHIHHLFQGLLTDGGGIYNLGKTDGMLIEYNKIHDIVGYSLSYSCGCIYYDQGSTNIINRYNLLYAAVILTLTSGRGHYTYNNILAYPITAITSFGYSQNWLNIAYENNVFLHDKGSLIESASIESPSSLIGNLEISNNNSIDSYSSSIRTNNYHTDLNPFVNSLNEDFNITQQSAYSVFEDCGFIFSNMNPNAQINNFNFEVWWRGKEFTQGVSEDMWYYSNRDLTAEEKNYLKNMYVSHFGEIGEYWNIQ